MNTDYSEFKPVFDWEGEKGAIREMKLNLNLYCE